MRFEVQIELGGTQTPLAFEADDGRALHAAMRQFCADNNYRFANATATRRSGLAPLNAAHVARRVPAARGPHR